MARKSKAKKMSKQDQEMELLLNEQTDPVSGNTAPLGAKPEEVRDDVEINVSPNEFVINAATVRYFGEDFFRELQETAAEGWERIKEGEESPFRDDELEVMEEEGEPKEGYAEGGPVPKPVGGGYGGYGGRGATFTGFQSKTFVNPDTGQEMVIFFFMGRPLSRIPDGFFEKGTVDVEEDAEPTVSTNDDDRPAPQVEQTWRTKNVDEWTMEDFDAYNKAMGPDVNAGELSLIERGVIGMIGGVIGGPLGGAALLRLAEKANQKQAEAVAAKSMAIIESGINPDTGAKLSAAELTTINGSRINANYVQQNLAQPTELLGGVISIPGVGDGVTEEEVVSQQQAVINAAKEQVQAKIDAGMTPEEAKEGSIYDTPVGDTPSTFYGGTAATETALIQDTSLSDEEFWEEFEAGTPSGAAATFASNEPPQGIVGNTDTGKNTFAQNIANSLTPNDGKEYQNGILVDTTKSAGLASKPATSDPAPAASKSTTSTPAAQLPTDTPAAKNAIESAVQEAVAYKPEPSDPSTSVESVKTTNVVNRTGGDVTIGQISPGGQDAGDGFVWEKKEGTNALTRKYVGKDTTTSSSSSSSNDDGGSSGGSSGGSDKILCDLIYRYGYLDEDIWRLDEAFGDIVAKDDPELLEGYHIWAKPMVAWIEEESFLAKLYLKYWCVPFTRRWANHIAHIMEPDKYKPDHIGKLMLTVGVPISKAIYKWKAKKGKGYKTV